MGGLAVVLAADTRQARLCAALRAHAAPPYAAHEFAVHPHENFELALGFLDFEQRVQLQPRQAVVLDFAGECRRPSFVLGSLVSAVEDGGFHFLDGGAYVRFPEHLVALAPRPQAGP